MIIYKTKQEIIELSDKDFIEYAHTVDIHKVYTFDEFLQVKQVILDEMYRRNLSLEQITPQRIFIEEKFIKKVINNI